ncbi:jg13949 [Pararge aegeria aegeria]|uniref:Mitochondrial cardiolipin hydrolase n=1 Tax=Pararge aegeria aegeria TaxID=348720 RepID=A0A8S4RQX8_9NEOP|nr:jg13949 [Pararge aegeria aegeria]
MTLTYNNRKTNFLLSACVSTLSRITAKLKQLLTTSKRVNINEVLLYDAGKENIKKQLGLNNLCCIYYVIVHARLTIDLCLPSLDSVTISRCLVRIRQKNKTRVRIILHRNPDSSVKPFLDFGMEVKVIRKSEVQLEHEFILIDAQGECEEALVIIGSLDDAVNRVTCNRNNTLITSENAIVFSLKREFDRIWDSIADTEQKGPSQNKNKNVIQC